MGIVMLLAAAVLIYAADQKRKSKVERIPNWRRRKREDRGIHQGPEDVAEAPLRVVRESRRGGRNENLS